MDFEAIITKIKTLALDAAKKEAETAAALYQARQAKEDAVKRQKKAVADGEREDYIRATADLQNAATALDFAELTHNAAMKKPKLTTDEADTLYGELSAAANEKYQEIADAMIKALEEAKRLALEAEQMTAAYSGAAAQINRLRKDAGIQATPYFGKTAACISRQLETRINAIRFNLK